MSNVEPKDVCTSPNPRAASSPRLLIDGISTFYGEAQALKEVAIEVHPKEVVAILGSNGAGKSTILKTLTGLLSPRSGSIIFKGDRIEGQPPHEIIRRGIASVPEGRELFGAMTVRENLDSARTPLAGSEERKAS